MCRITTEVIIPAVTLSKRSTVLVVISVCVLSGCSGLHTSSVGTQANPVNVTANNTANSTYTLEIFLINSTTDIHIVRNDGMNDTMDSPGHSYSEGPGEGFYFTLVDPEPAQLVLNMTVSPGEVGERTIRNRPVNTKVMIVPYDEQGRIPEWHVEDCDKYGFYRITVDMTAEGVFTDVVCN